jgi:hypothetical protein
MQSTSKPSREAMQFLITIPGKPEPRLQAEVSEWLEVERWLADYIRAERSTDRRQYRCDAE